MSDGLEKGISVLKGQETYKEWARQMQGYIRSIGAWQIIKGTETTPAATDTAALKEWNNRNDCCIGLFMLKTSAEVAKCYDGKENAKDIWDAIKATYDKSDTGNSFARAHRGTAL